MCQIRPRTYSSVTLGKIVKDSIEKVIEDWKTTSDSVSGNVEHQRREFRGDREVISKLKISSGGPVTVFPCIVPQHLTLGSLSL